MVKGIFDNGVFDPSRLGTREEPVCKSFNVLISLGSSSFESPGVDLHDQCIGIVIVINIVVGPSLSA